MQRPIRLVVALLVAATVSLAPTLAFAGADGAPSSSSAGSDEATPPRDSGPADDETRAPTDAAEPTTDPTGDTEKIDVDERNRDRVRLACESSTRDGGHSIGCKWSEASTAAAAGYRLWRAVDVPNPRDHRRIIARGGLDFRSNVDTDVSAGHTYHYAVEIVDGRGRTLGWSDTVRVALVRNEQLELACDGVDGDRGTGIFCEWSESQHPRFAGYRLIRSNGDVRETVLETREVSTTRFLDEKVRRGVRYTYGIQAVDANGNVIGKGGPSTAGLRPIPDEELRFDCTLTSDGDHRGVACTWEEATHPDARGYVLYRSVDNGAREELFRTGIDGPNRSFDRDVSAGHRYRYAVVLLDRAGEAIGGGGPVTIAIPRPAPTPVPADPTPADSRPHEPAPTDRPADENVDAPTDRSVPTVTERPVPAR